MRALKLKCAYRQILHAMGRRVAWLSTARKCLIALFHPRSFKPLQCAVSMAKIALPGQKGWAGWATAGSLLLVLPIVLYYCFGTDDYSQELGSVRK